MRDAARIFIAAGFCLCLGFSGQPGSARQDAVKLQKPLEYQVSVTLKLIQAYVTDKKGKPVEDLTRNDFVVYEDGRPMIVTEFERHVLSPPPSQTAAAEAAQPAAPSISPASIRKFLLFFDFAYNNQRGVVKAREAALHFIDTQLKPDDAAAVMSYSALGGLAVHEFFTADHRKVREAVADLNGKRIAGRAEDIEERFWRQAAEGSPPLPAADPHDATPPPKKTAPIFNWQRQETKDVAQNYIIKLTSLARAMRYVPGQKNIVLFSTGIATSLIYGNQEGNPLETAQAYGENPARSVFDVGDHIVKSLNEEMLKEMSAANCAMFTFDTREAAVVPSLFTYDEQTFEETTRHRDIFYDEGVHQLITNPLKDDRITGLYYLRRFSAVTGGKYFSNIVDYKSTLNELQTLTGAFYILGYAIPKTADGRYHKLKVEVKRKGCQVKSQTGYFNPRPFGEFSDLEKQLHLFDLALSDRPVLQAPMSFPLTALSFSAGFEGRLELVARIPTRVIDKFEGKKVEMIALVFDERDNVAGLQRREADLTRFKGADVCLMIGRPLAPGSYKGRVVIRDLATGESARATVPIFIKNKPMNGLAPASPLLLGAQSRLAYLESEATGKIPFSSSDVYPFERSLYSPLCGEFRAGSSKIYALLPISAIGLVHPAIAVAASLVEATTGEKIPLRSSILLRSARGDLEIEFLEIDLEGIPPGKYSLYFFVQDAISRVVAFVQTNLVIMP